MTRADSLEGDKCSRREAGSLARVYSLFPHLHTPFSPSLISLVVCMDVKHHVYLFTPPYPHLPVPNKPCGFYGRYAPCLYVYTHKQQCSSNSHSALQMNRSFQVLSHRRSDHTDHNLQGEGGILTDFLVLV